MCQRWSRACQLDAPGHSLLASPCLAVAVGGVRLKRLTPVMEPPLLDGQSWEVVVAAARLHYSRVAWAARQHLRRRCVSSCDRTRVSTHTTCVSSWLTYAWTSLVPCLCRVAQALASMQVPTRLRILKECCVGSSRYGAWCGVYVYRVAGAKSRARLPTACLVCEYVASDLSCVTALLSCTRWTMYVAVRCCCFWWR